MTATSHRFALHVNVADQIAHLVSISLGAGVASHNIAGLWFGPIKSPMQEFLSWALELTYSDADGVLMAMDMQGKDEEWFQLDIVAFNMIAALPIPEVRGQPFAGHRCEGDRIFATIRHDTELDITPMLSLPTLLDPQ